METAELFLLLLKIETDCRLFVRLRVTVPLSRFVLRTTAAERSFELRRLLFFADELLSDRLLLRFTLPLPLRLFPDDRFTLPLERLLLLRRCTFPRLLRLLPDERFTLPLERLLLLLRFTLPLLLLLLPEERFTFPLFVDRLDERLLTVPDDDLDRTELLLLRIFDLEVVRSICLLLIFDRADDRV